MHRSAVLTTLLATVATARPGNLVFPNRATGAVNWFERYDCQDPCVETSAVCPDRKKLVGIGNSVTGLLDQGSGCWDRPDGVHSLSVTVNNGEPPSCRRAVFVSC